MDNAAVASDMGGAFEGVQSKQLRVFHNPVLQKLIVERLARCDQLEFWLVSKAFVPLVASKVLKEVDWETYQRLDRSTAMGRHFCDAVNNIQVWYNPSNISHQQRHAELSPSSFDAERAENIRKKCPNISLFGAYETLNNRIHSCRSFYTSQYSKSVQFFEPVDIDIGIDFTDHPPISQTPAWHGWSAHYVHRVRMISLSGSSTLTEGRCRKYLEWIICREKPDFMVRGIELIDIPCCIRDIERLATKQSPNDFNRLQHVEAHMVAPFTMAEFENLAKSLSHCRELRHVALYHWDAGQSGSYMRSPLITITELPSLASALQGNCTYLSDLTLTIKAMNGDNFFAEEELPLSAHPYIFDKRSQLRRLTLVLEEDFGRHPEKLPLFALARNLAPIACLDVRIGYVNTTQRGWTELPRESYLLSVLVVYLWCLPNERREHLRHVNFRTLDMPIPNFNEIMDLTFAPDGRPVPRKTEKALWGLECAAAHWKDSKDLEDTCWELFENNQALVVKAEALLKERGEVPRSLINPFEGYRDGVLEDLVLQAFKEEVKVSRKGIEVILGAQKATREATDSLVRNKVSFEGWITDEEKRRNELRVEVESVEVELRSLGWADSS